MTTAISERSPRRWGVDPRLLIGLALVLVSVAGVVGVVVAGDSTVPVYAAEHTLVPGDRITPDDLVLRQVTLDGAESLYLSETSWPDDGAIVVRAIGDGELVPSASLGESASEHLASLVVETAGRLSAAVLPGTRADIWGAPPSTDHPEKSTTAGESSPTVLVAGATVVRIIDHEGMTVDSGTVSVEMLVPRTSVAQLLQATAEGAALSLVPAALPLASAPQSPSAEVAR